MKNSFNLEIINTGRTLTRDEQNSFRNRLKNLLKADGVNSLCLEAESLYVEFNPALFNLDSFKMDLQDVGFPLKNNMKLTSLNFSG